MRVVEHACTGRNHDERTRREIKSQTPPSSVSGIGGTRANHTMPPATPPDWAESAFPLPTHRGLSGPQLCRPLVPHPGGGLCDRGLSRHVTAGLCRCTAGVAAAPSPCPGGSRGSGRSLMRVGVLSGGRAGTLNGPPGALGSSSPQLMN